MTLLLLGLVLFLGVHSFGLLVARRERLIGRLGEQRYKGLYTVLSLLSFYLLLKGFAIARLEPLPIYHPPAALRVVTLLLMLPVFPLLLATYLPGRISTTLKHPTLVAVKAWAVAHLLSNGMAADVLLFGGFLVWAVVLRISYARRPVRKIPTAPRRTWNDALAVVLGLILYAAFVGGLHRWMFGAAPLG
jgi:uncharacterized membrane protein